MIVRAALALACFAACTHVATAPVCPAAVPAALAPGADQRLAFVLHARGVQQYACNGTAWTLVAPAADLFDDTGVQVGTHAAGPTWTLTDGSAIRGTKLAEAAVDHAAIPWLLVDVAEHLGGAGRMSDITRVQRLRTIGGRAPATGCDASQPTATTSVPYTADYFFYRAGGTATDTRCGP